jgi:predicted  nucleic acid-binding Zn-ribbon protein
MECIREETDEKNQDNEDNENFDVSANSARIFDLENKMSSIEKKLKNLELLNKVNKFTGKGDDNSDDIQLMKIELTNLSDSNKKLIQENLDMKKQLENINVKLQDINIYDLFKGLNVSDGSIDVAKGLIMNLETKVFKKIGFMDERDKKLNFDFLELKNNVQNVINKNGIISHNMDNIKKNFKELGDLVGANSTETSTMINNVESKMNGLYKDIIFKFEE